MQVKQKCGFVLQRIIFVTLLSEYAAFANGTRGDVS